MFTYRQLLEKLNQLPDERLDDTATVYDQVEDEFYAAHGLEINDLDDVLDLGHPYIVFNEVEE